MSFVICYLFLFLFFPVYLALVLINAAKLTYNMPKSNKLLIFFLQIKKHICILRANFGFRYYKKLNISKGIFFLFLFFLLAIFSCSSHRLEVRNEKARRKEQAFIKKERRQDEVRLYEYAVKRQKKIQSKETRKRMKELQKEADIFHGVKKEFFLKKWFTPKRKRRSPKPGEELLL